MAAHHGRLAGHDKVLALDMGGTTAKMAVIQGGRPRISRRFEIDRVEMREGSGLPIDIPAIDLIEIGAGGGSIAACFAGVLKVGPRSAGADPGPACYGRGGAEPTLTDAYLALGYVSPEYFAGGTMALDRAAAESCLDRLGRELQLDRTMTAWSVYELATFEMERAIRLISVNKGLDPREFAMVCFGGAGPAHGCRLARALGIRRVIFPVGAGVGSAVGLVESEESVELAKTMMVALDAPDAAPRIRSVLDELAGQADEMIAAGWRRDEITLRRSVGLRYAGQAHELELQCDASGFAPEELAARFNAEYEQTYGYREGNPVEAVTWYCTVSRPRAENGRVVSEAVKATASAPAMKGRRDAYFADRGMVPVEVFDRDRLTPGMWIEGPALVEERYTTIVLQPGDGASLDGHGSLVVTLEDEGADA